MTIILKPCFNRRNLRIYIAFREEAKQRYLTKPAAAARKPGGKPATGTTAPSASQQPKESAVVLARGGARGATTRVHPHVSFGTEVRYTPQRSVTSPVDLRLASAQRSRYLAFRSKSEDTAQHSNRKYIL